MKNLMIVALGLGLLTISACTNSKKANTSAVPAEQEIVTDSAFQQAAAGDYKSLDGKTVISLSRDFTVKTQNYSKEYYKWELLSAPNGATEAVIVLDRKGVDKDIKDNAAIDVEEGKIVVNNETFRKKAK